MDEQNNLLNDALALHTNLIGPTMQQVQPEAEKPIHRSRRKETITTINLTSSTCRWPFGDPVESDFHYCGQRSQTNGPYCDTHEAMSRPSGQHKKSR